MERRIYSGPIQPADLADHLVRHYDPQENLQAQNISQGTGHAVQIARGDAPEESRYAVTVAISEAPEGEEGIAVTLGQHQWLTPQLATFAATVGLIGVIVTPWALFGLLWPVTEMAGSAILPNDIWDTVEAYVLSHGGAPVRTEELTHPHAAAGP